MATQRGWDGSSHAPPAPPAPHSPQRQNKPERAERQHAPDKGANSRGLAYRHRRLDARLICFTLPRRIARLEARYPLRLPFNGAERLPAIFVREGAVTT